MIGGFRYLRNIGKPGRLSIIGRNRGSSETYVAPPDITPDAFSFTAVTGAALSTAYVSNTITVTGIDAPSALTVSGGEYSINGGAYATAPTTVSLGNTVKVRVTSASGFLTNATVTLDIGGITASFVVTTLAMDTVPNSFSFTDVNGATAATLYVSNTVTISGINAPATTTITGGEYSINGGAYASTSTTVSNSDTVAVRQTSSSSYATPQDVVLTIGGVSDTYTVTTKAFAPTDLGSKLKAWWDANDITSGSSQSSITDKVGSTVLNGGTGVGWSATGWTATGSYNNSPAITLNGSQWLDKTTVPAAWATGTADGWMLLIVSQDAGSGDTSSRSIFGYGSTAADGARLIRKFRSTLNRVQSYTGTGSGLFQSNVAFDGPHTVFATFTSGTTIDGYVDNARINNAPASSTISTGTTRVRLGTDLTGTPSAFSTVKIKGILVGTGTLDATERGNLLTWAGLYL